MNLMQRFASFKLAGVLILLSFFLLAPHKALAKNITIAPAYQEIELKKGDEVTSNITLTNDTEKPITFNLFTLNFAQNDKGLIEFLGRDSTSYSFALASFINLPQDSVTVEAGTKETISFTIKDRQDLSPGGHYAAVVAQAEGAEVKGSAQFTPALASLLLLRKTGGEIFNLSLKEISWPHRIVHFSYPEKVDLTFQNEGNIHVVPRGRVEVYDIFGRLTHKGVLNTASQYVFPSSRRTISVALNKVALPLPISINHVIIKGNDSLGKVSYSYRETYIHISLIGLIIFALIIITFALIFYRKRRLIRI